MSALSRDKVQILAESKQKAADFCEKQAELSNGSCFVDSMRLLRPVCYVEGATWVPSSWLWQFDVGETAPQCSVDKGPD